MTTIRTKGIVMRRTNFGEADRIIQFLTPDYGTISAIARGVRKEKSKLAGGVELFGRSDITLTKGKGDLWLLTSARLERFYSHIMSDYDRLIFGYEAIKQINRGSNALDEPAFFELLDQVFEAIETTSIPLGVTKAWFWLQLAILLGIGLNLTSDSDGNALKPDEQYDFDIANSVLVRRQGGRFGADHIKLLRVISGNSPKVVAKIDNIGPFIDDCLWISEHAVAH